MEKEEETYHDFSNVEKQRDYLIPEEFPEGPFGSAIAQDAPVRIKVPHGRKGNDIKVPLIMKINRCTKTYLENILVLIRHMMIRKKMNSLLIKDMEALNMKGQSAVLAFFISLFSSLRNMDSQNCSIHINIH